MDTGQKRARNAKVARETRALGLQLAGIGGVILAALVTTSLLVPSLRAPLSAFVVFFVALLIWLLYSLHRDARWRAARTTQQRLTVKNSRRRDRVPTGLRPPD